MKKYLFVFLFLCVYGVWLHGSTGKCEQLKIVIPQGGSMQTVENILLEKKCIRSKFLFDIYTNLLNPQVRQGTYIIAQSLPLYGYITAFSREDVAVQTRFVIPEGYTNEQIATQCQAKLNQCNAKEFVEQAKTLQGYLFPDTYIFGGGETKSEVIAVMQKTFEKKARPLLNTYMGKLSAYEIINLASIVEREANNETDMKMIADILLRRLQIGMALQVDATLFYERGEGTYDLSIKELRQDSPYNTYTNIGLPPTPIANPGLRAIGAVVNPIQNKYLFYLTGVDGKMRYAVTHDEHVRNKRLYLR